jgi:hypothetical protein
MLGVAGSGGSDGRVTVLAGGIDIDRQVFARRYRRFAACRRLAGRAAAALFTRLCS